ncbi:MAG: UvrD-helicase domain-containing protein [Burkholderiales bacterium]|nr:UvrD-helicase domain-containing protein [Burkholderiales bacterium]
MNANNHPLQIIDFAEVQNSYVIEASAGTGKTWTIERLYIKALLEANVENLHALSIENILVVTFTNDATNELKERINEQLQYTINALIYLRNNPLPSELSNDLFLVYLLTRVSSDNVIKDITQLTRALQNFDQASIFTIHGFCQRVLSDYQLECNVAPDFDLISSNKEILESIVERFLRKEIYTEDIFAHHLLNVEKNLRMMFCRDYSENLVQKITDKLPKDLLLFTDNKWVIKYQFDEELQKKSINLHTLSELGNEELDKEDIVRLKSLFLVKLINFTYKEFLNIVDNIQYETFDNLIQKLANGIVYNSNLADILFKKYPIAFIDEFQDTDDLQWQIFSSIYSLSVEKRGHLIVVGDPKQAIYRFRGADVDTYLFAAKEIGNRLELVNNYRSHPNIMSFINQLFSLANQNSTLEDSFLGNNIDYLHVEASGKFSNILPNAKVVSDMALDLGVSQSFYDDEVQIIVPRGINNAERKERMLQNIALEILSLLAVNPNLKGKIAILVTTSYEATEVVGFLRRYNLKVAELRLGNIFATNTAHDLHKLLLAIFDLNTRNNFISALTVPILNISFAELSTDDSGNNLILEKWYKRFFEYNGIWQKKGIFSVVYHLIDDIVEDGNSNLNNRELANLYQLAELLVKQMRTLSTQSELLFWFKQKINDANNSMSNNLDGENEELVRLDTDDEQITITTQHSSKGLEYEILFCPFFKANNTLDKDYNYNRPFFSSYTDNGAKTSSIITDNRLGKQIITNDNKEINRLNYVALTRAKSRIYIFLEQVTITKSTGKYSSMSKPDKIGELFGFVADDPSDNSHALFNYPMFFSNEPMLALKRPAEHKGVVVFRRDNIFEGELNKLANYVSNNLVKNIDLTNNKDLDSLTIINPALMRQSYTAITTHDNDMNYTDYYVKEVSFVESPKYKYPVLTDGELRGAKFGILFHNLCEEYPFNKLCLDKLIQPYNFIDKSDIALQLTNMIEDTFNYPILDGYSLNNIEYKMHELEFNLTIANPINIANELCDIFAKYFGDKHLFTESCKTLNKIDNGFLVGFIDLFFEYNGKYWVLDYKTNALNNYTFSRVNDSTEIINSMAEHHYYLQYVLYLVAIKRYLEQRLAIDDATHLLGGSIYFYVKGIFTDNHISNDGIFIDDSCGQMISEVDDLLRGVKNV